VCQECDWARNHPDDDPAISPANDFKSYDQFVEELWFYDPAAHGSMPELGYLGLCCTEEAGEIAGKLKKFYRDGGDFASDEFLGQKLLREIGDELYYLVKLAHVLGYSLEDVARANEEKLRDRQARGQLRGAGDDR
jgi:NTP pyrophosphatase (non-canonical NTP hydrolase)